MIEDLAKTRCGSQPKLFYQWCYLKFGPNTPFTYEDCKEYGMSRRTVFRYMAKLEEKGMLQRELKPVSGKAGGKTVLKIN